MEEFIRDNAMTAAILGTFAFAWFGWAQQDPPKNKAWPIALGAGSGLALIVAIIGGLIAWQNWDGASRISGENFAGYMWVFIIEFIIIALATAVLFIIKKSKYIPTVVGLIVGIHFLPLAGVFQDPLLAVLAIWIIAATLMSLKFYKEAGNSLVTLTCTQVAIPLFIFALRGLFYAIF